MSRFILNDKGKPARFVYYDEAKGRVNSRNACEACSIKRHTLACGDADCIGGYFVPVRSVKHLEELALARLKGEV